ncbi:unnamed protein product [Cyprideis torosa]|uniref:Branchpoint-bridging protein n=1 Tax=Cyprideis torosa TaxID=163714 RepID=A0A7R8ZQS4_9CRUS|nr:unnamed protein product [Cyprideis torosa]CAG0892654.1 unnamed protein product [Cyprideis torosa]
MTPVGAPRRFDAPPQSPVGSSGGGSSLLRPAYLANAPPSSTPRKAAAFQSSGSLLGTPPSGGGSSHQSSTHAVQPKTPAALQAVLTLKERLAQNTKGAVDIKIEPPALGGGGGGSGGDSPSSRKRSRFDQPQEETKRKRKSRWADDADDPLKTKLGLMAGLPTVLPSGLTKEQEEAFLLNIKIEEITRRLKSGDLGIPSNPEERSPSPEPVYNNEGKRMNTREYRTRKKLEEQRHQAIERIRQLNPEFKPPPDYKPPQVKVHDKVWIPQDNHPEVNFIGLLIGPRGNTLKSMEKETGAKIIIRGKGSVREGKVGSAPLPGQDEPLHAYVTAPTKENVAKAVDKIKQVIAEAVTIPDGQNDLRKQQMRELALLNGTFLREGDDQRCSNCYATDHRTWECQDRANITQSVLCAACGSAGHIARDCMMNRRGGGPMGGNDPEKNKIEEEYSAFMAELGEGDAGGGGGGGYGGAGGYGRHARGGRGGGGMKASMFEDRSGPQRALPAARGDGGDEGGGGEGGMRGGYRGGPRGGRGGPRFGGGGPRHRGPPPGGYWGGGPPPRWQQGGGYGGGGYGGPPAAYGGGPPPRQGGWGGGGNQWNAPPPNWGGAPMNVPPPPPPPENGKDGGASEQNPSAEDKNKPVNTGDQQQMSTGYGGDAANGQYGGAAASGYYGGGYGGMGGYGGGYDGYGASGYGADMYGGAYGYSGGYGTGSAPPAQPPPAAKGARMPWSGGGQGAGPRRTGGSGGSGASGGGVDLNALAQAGLPSLLAAPPPPPPPPPS